jgi:hypothetical protein
MRGRGEIITVAIIEAARAAFLSSANSPKYSPGWYWYTYSGAYPSREIYKFLKRHIYI